MNPLSSQPKNSVRIILLALVLLLVGPACLSTAAIAEVQASQSAGRGVETPVAEPTRQDKFSSYGFTVSGFSAEQEAIILKTLNAYAEAFGGRENLRQFITEYNRGEEKTISFIPDAVGANSGIELTPTVFSLEKAQNANYSTYGTSDEELHSKIIIVHEIGHIVLWAVKAKTGTDWAKSYEQRVKRDWQRINNSLAPEQEAVTELGLFIIKSDYYLNLNLDQKETDPETRAQIKAWVEDILGALRQA